MALEWAKRLTSCCPRQTCTAAGREDQSHFYKYKFQCTVGQDFGHAICSILSLAISNEKMVMNIVGATNEHSLASCLLAYLYE